MTYLGSHEFSVKLAEEIIFDTFGDRVSVWEKKKTLLKFGKREDVGTSTATIAKLGAGELHETYVSTNAITTISSSDAGDTGAAKLEYHTVSGGVFTFGIQDVTLNGQNQVTLTTPCARVSRLYNDTSTDWVGDIYVYETDTATAGVPNTATKVHMVVPAGQNQTFKMATTISNTDYWIVTGGAASVNKKTSASVDFELQIRQANKVFRPAAIITLDSASGNNFEVFFDPPVIVPKNADVRVVATASTTAVAVSAWINGYLAKVT